ncbi:MAG: type II toxin-antitoxin system VapC family toxin [Balneolaceae bacterium]
MNVVDTSVVTKWFFREPNSDIAVKLLQKERFFYAPDYLKIEFLSNITKKVRAGFLTANAGRDRRGDVDRMSLYFELYKELENLAFELSTQYPITFYDALFVALAFRERVVLYTFDKRLKRSIKGTELDRFVVIPD